MKQPICWTEREDDGVKIDIRVEVSSHSINWQFKRKDQDTWDSDREPDMDEWETLADILERRAARGRSLNLQKIVQKCRHGLGHPGITDPTAPPPRKK